MSKPVESWELSAFVDGDLPPERMAEIESEADRDPVLHQRLAELLADHHGLAELARAEIEATKDLPPRIASLAADLAVGLEGRKARATPRWLTAIEHTWRQAVGLTAGVAVGWAAASWAAPSTDTVRIFIDESTEIHRVASVAPDFALKASPAIIENVGEIFGYRLEPPDLTAAGYTLGRVDIAATDLGPAAIFLYADSDARRLSLVYSMDTPVIEALESDGAAPRVTTYSGLAVAYGGAQGVAFAVVASMPEPRALQIGNLVSNALNN